MTETTEGGLAWVNGKPISSREAIDTAAALLADSRSAVVAGLGTDIAGAQESLALVRTIGASIDHMDAGAIFADLDVMRRAGWIVTTPLQTRARADTVLLVGDRLPEVWPEMFDRLALDGPPTLTGGARRVFRFSSDTVGPVGGTTILPALAALVS
jgi:formylmethanofuran dehydrogenase subunit B